MRALFAGCAGAGGVEKGGRVIVAARIFAMAIGLACSVQAGASDILCSQLDEFALAQEAEPAEPMPRHWVEFHWGIDPDPNSFWSWGCRNSNDVSSKSLCSYLLESTSREFRNTLPIRILKCWGYRFPKDAGYGWHVSEGHFIQQRKNGSWLVMDIASRGLQPDEQAIRISYDTVDRKLEPDELPAVQPLQDGEGFKLPP